MDIYAGSLRYEKGFKRYYVRTKVQGKYVSKYFSVRNRTDEETRQEAERVKEEWEKEYGVERLKIYSKIEKGVWKVDIRSKPLRHIKKFVVKHPKDKDSVRALAETYQKNKSDELGLTVHLTHCPEEYLGWLGGFFDGNGLVCVGKRVSVEFAKESQTDEVPECLLFIQKLYGQTPHTLTLRERSNQVSEYHLTFYGIFAQVLIEDLLRGSFLKTKVLYEAQKYIQEKCNDGLLITCGVQVKEVTNDINPSYVAGLFDAKDNVFMETQQISVCMNCRGMLNLMKHNYRGRVNSKNETWVIDQKADILYFLQTILPHTVMKKSQILECIKNINSPSQT